MVDTTSPIWSKGISKEHPYCLDDTCCTSARARAKKLTCSLYSIVVFPAESNPTINIRTSLSFPHDASEVREEYNRDKDKPIVNGTRKGVWKLQTVTVTGVGSPACSVKMTMALSLPCCATLYSAKDALLSGADKDPFAMTTGPSRTVRYDA